MQIIPFPAHYQPVYTNFDISSFSLISCLAKDKVSLFESSPIAMQKMSFCNQTHTILVIKQLKNRFLTVNFLWFTASRLVSERLTIFIQKRSDWRRATVKKQGFTTTINNDESALISHRLTHYSVNYSDLPISIHYSQIKFLHLP